MNGHVLPAIETRRLDFGEMRDQAGVAPGDLKLGNTVVRDISPDVRGWQDGFSQELEVTPVLLGSTFRHSY